ncbi:type II toxin-antitoxin system RelE/ParE family toxin [uncultured Sphingomonas sp.]|uniref:type II toxin-antitoxin system RelE/ParE family toxin n=1 Tax=uncultured Sphingomonas sp. TaxID=158754 RepID=UPI0035C95CF3
MPHLIITPAALNGIARCARFLRERNPAAQERAAAAIEQRLAVLIQTPAIGRPYRAEPTKRELVIPFGDSGYLALYRQEEAADAVTILAFRHQREAGY